jgi:putative ABC transport system permease protein
MSDLLQDLRYAARMLAANPVVAIVIVLALALGIGANTALFSVVDAVLLRPLPYPDPERLVMIWGHFAGIGLPKNQNWISVPEFMDVKELNRSFSNTAVFAGGAVAIKAGSVPEQIDAAFVSADFFPVLGVRPQLGRGFLPGDDQPGHDNVVVLGHGIWQRQFGGNAGVVGTTLSVNGEPHTVVGIAPAWFRFPADTEIWKPVAFTPDSMAPNSRGNHGLQLLARIRPGVSFEQARADAESVTRRIIERTPDYPYRDFQFRLILSPLLDETVGDIRGALWILMGAVGFVLLIACANVANLLLARAGAREREIAIRAALGASRRRMIRQLLTESTFLALIGGGLGLLLAWWGLEMLIQIGSVSFPRISAATLDARVLAFTLAVALLTGILFGTAPALQASRAKHDTLKEGGRGLTAGAASQRLRGLLVVAEIALSLVLLVGAGLLLKSFFRLHSVDAGFSTEGILTMRIGLPQVRYPEPSDVGRFYRDVLERVRRLPGVEVAGATSALPLSGTGSSGTTTIDTRAVPPQEASPEADWRAVTPGFFEAMGIRLIRGRYFEERDAETATPAAIIDETMAETYWPEDDPIGKRLKRGGMQSRNPWMTVVGVVKHVRYRTLEERSRVQLYWPHLQNPSRSMSLALRTSVDPAALSPAVQRVILGLDPDRPVSRVRTMEELLADSIARRKFSMLLLAIFAAAALLLASIGVYGVLSFAVTQRSHEMGIRMALGASRGSVLRLVMSQSLALALTGAAIGLAASFWLTRLISTLLFDVKAHDPATFALVPAFLVAVALAAGYLPARRATKVDPMIVLRYE